MKPFRYTLQPVLILRQRQETQALEAYAHRLSARQRAANELTTVNQQVEAHTLHHRRVLTDGCTAGELEQLRGYHGRLEERRLVARNALLGTERAVSRSLKDLLLARQKREAMDQHRDQMRTQYDHTLNSEETKALDDLAGRYFRARTISPVEPQP